MSANDWAQAQAQLNDAFDTLSRFCLVCKRELPSDQYGIAVEGKRPGTWKGLVCHGCNWHARKYVDALRGR